MLEIVRETCGPNVRLDHAYGIVMSPGTSGLGLHGGGTPFDPPQYYLVEGGRIRTGLVAAQWALVDHPPGAGGFVCIPGSHKAGFALPATFDRDLAIQVPLAAGDVVVFSEALTHGTLPWQSPRGAAHARLQVLARKLGVVAGRLAAGAAGRLHRPPAPAAAAARASATTARRAVAPPSGRGSVSGRESSRKPKTESAQSLA